MAPHKSRRVHEEPRSESSITREKHLGYSQSGVSKVRRYAAATAGMGNNLKDASILPATTSIQHNDSDSLDSTEKACAPKGWPGAHMANLTAHRSNGHPSTFQSSPLTGKHIISTLHAPLAPIPTSTSSIVQASQLHHLRWLSLSNEEDRARSTLRLQ